MLWATSYFFEVSHKPRNIQVLIRPVYFFMLVTYLAICFPSLRRHKRAKDNADERIRPSVDKETKTILISMLVTVCYIYLLPRLGFFVATVLFLTTSFLSLGAKHKMVAIISAVVFTMAVYAVFHHFLGVPLPKGLLG
jgi:Tripartite tricarboxylate transporter TctB family.